MNFKDVQLVRHKVQHLLQTITFILELILALIVTAIIVMQGIHLIKLFVAHVFDPAVTVQYSDFLKEALDIIVGVEFLKMLCQHSMCCSLYSPVILLWWSPPCWKVCCASSPLPSSLRYASS